MLYIVNSEFYIIHDHEGKFYVRVKDILEYLGYKGKSSKVKNYIKKCYDCKLFFDFQITYTKIPKNSYFLEFEGIIKMINDSYGKEKDKSNLKAFLHTLINVIQKIPLTLNIADTKSKQYIHLVLFEKIIQINKVVGKNNQMSTNNQAMDQQETKNTDIQMEWQTVNQQETMNTDIEMKVEAVNQQDTRNVLTNEIDMDILNKKKISSTIKNQRKSSKDKTTKLLQVIEELKKRNVTITPKPINIKLN